MRPNEANILTRLLKMGSILAAFFLPLRLDKVGAKGFGPRNAS